MLVFWPKSTWSPLTVVRLVRVAQRAGRNFEHMCFGRVGNPGIQRAPELAGGIDPCGPRVRGRSGGGQNAEHAAAAAPGTGGRATYAVDSGPMYHSDLGHHSDFYQAGDPLTVSEAATVVRRDAGWLRRAIRSGRLTASRGPAGYLLRRRDVERLDRTARRRTRVPMVVEDAAEMDTSES